MKSTLNKTSSDEYPCLKIVSDHVDSEKYVILFSSKKHGMVVYSAENAPYGLGHYSNNWMENLFERLPSGSFLKIEA